RLPLPLPVHPCHLPRGNPCDNFPPCDGYPFPTRTNPGLCPWHKDCFRRQTTPAIARGRRDSGIHGIPLPPPRLRRKNILSPGFFSASCPPAQDQPPKASLPPQWHCHHKNA